MMYLRFSRLMVLCVVITGAFTVSPGCSSTPTAKETVDSMGGFGVEVAKVKDSIDHAIHALETVVGSQPSDINPNLVVYSNTVAALESQAEVVRGHAEEMKATGDEFFEEWETPENMTPERRAELTAAYAKIKENMVSAKEGFTPFLASLKDIESYLKVDPSTKGIQSMSELVKKAKASGAKVKSSIDAVLTQVNSVHGMLSTQ
jgi:hypothetical protein